MDEFTTKAGTVRVGQLYRDSRASNVRTLRVDSIETPDAFFVWADIYLSVIEVDGESLAKPRQTRMSADQLLTRSFVLVIGDSQ